MKKKSIFFVISLLILVGTACSSNTANSGNTPSSDTTNSNNSEINSPTESGSNPPDTSKPLTLAESTINVTLEEGTTTTAIIGTEGGSLSIEDANGTHYTLTIPENALPYAYEISMTPIASAEGDVIGDTFLAGVQLEPDGLNFFQLISLEITGAVVEEGAVGFTAQGDGQEFHLYPSTYTDGSVTLNLTHFSDPGIAKKDLQKKLEKLEGAGNAFLENYIAIKNTQQQITALEAQANRLMRRVTTGLEEWKEWNVEISKLIGLFVQFNNKLDQEPPGYDELLKLMQDLVDEWYIRTGFIVEDVGKYCDRGEIIYMPLAEEIKHAYYYYNLAVSAKDNFWTEQNEKWLNTMWSCTHWQLTWQANVETTGIPEFYSDISLGAEVEFNFNNAITHHVPEYILSSSTPLKVEYVQGFWDNKCAEPQDGSFSLELKIEYYPDNFWKDKSKVIGNITVNTKIDNLVHIDCSQGFPIPANLEVYFHGEALNQLNKERSKNGYWEYQLAYDPGYGIVGQFKEGAPWSDPLSLSWDQGKWNLAQLVTLYTGIPSE